MTAVGNLPADLTSLVGRVREGRDIRRLLGGARLVTLVGPGGVGKTRVALHVARTAARAFPDGAWFVELAALNDPALVESTVAAGLGKDVAMAQLPRLAERLRSWRGLLLLDNCEHLVVECARLVRDLLLHAPHLTVLATSRENLGLGGEQVVRIAPLTTPGRSVAPENLAEVDSARLFAERARAFDPGFAISATNADDIARICRQVDGIPLAIELAAARLQTMAVRQIAQRIGQPHEVLNRAPRDAPDRQASLEATISWSYRLCDPDEQRLWARMSVLAGPADAEAIQAVGDVGSGADSDLLEQLVKKSIIVREAGDVARFSMLETVRQYGRRQLDPAEYDEACARHCDYFERVVARCMSTWFSAEQQESANALRFCLPNLRLALDRLIREAPERSLVMASRMHMLWICLGRLREGDSWLSRALAAAPTDSPGRADALWVHGWIQLMLGQMSSARTSLTMSLATAEDTGLHRAADYATALLSMTNAFRGRLDIAIPACRDASERRRAAGDHAAVAFFQFLLAELYWAADDMETALELSTSSHRVCQAHGESWCASYALWIRALVLNRMGRHQQALSGARGSLQIKIELDDTLGVLLAAEAVGWTLAALGAWFDARQLHHAIEPRWRATCSPLMGFAELLTQRELWAARSDQLLGPADRRRAEAAADAMDLPSLARFALAEAGEPDRIRQDSEGRDGLTRREAEVAHLVADGLTNRDIADRLVISVRTVERHVDHILAKLGIARRGQVAAQLADSPATRVDTTQVMPRVSGSPTPAT